MNGPMLHRGKLARIPRILGIRPLVREDLARLAPSEGRVIPQVKAFRDTHHRLARMVASGMRNEEILRITGYSMGRLSTLKQSPAFQELVAGYRDKATEAWINERSENEAQASELIARGLRTMSDHYDEAEESGSLVAFDKALRATADLMDRFGYPKRNVQTSVTMDFAKEMEQMTAALGRSTVINGECSPSPLSPQEAGAPMPLPAPEGNPSARVAGFRRRI